MRRKKTKINFILILAPFLFFSLIYFIFFLSSKNIIIEPQNLSLYLKPYLSNVNILNFPTNISKILKDFPEIEKIAIKINPIKQQIILKIETSTIVAKICDVKNCFYLDNQSRIIQPRMMFQKNLLVITSSLSIENNTLLNPEIKNFLSILFEYSNWKPFILKEIKIYPNFDIGVIDNQNREFLFDPSRDLKEQIKKLEIFLRNNLKSQRIDLRIPQKIYFKTN